VTVWLDHDRYGHIQKVLKHNGIVTKHLVPIEVKEFEDTVIIPINDFDDNMDYFHDYPKWGKLGKEIDFTFINWDSVTWYKDWCLNSPEGEIAILESCRIEYLFEKLRVSMVPEKSTFEILFRWLSIIK
jgi:hypothetical protein